MKCQNCWVDLVEGATICSNCGADLTKQVRNAYYQPPVGAKSKTSAGIFAILLGGLGVHKFYLGQTGMGILYLLFCWTGIPSVIGLIEGILYLTMSDQEFYTKYQ
jgi:TM2 domain-containing membrane protein YozV